jgi:hypothetical protein
MKQLFFSFIVFIISYIGFIAAPLFIFGTSGSGVEQFKWTEEGRLASARIEVMNESGGPVSFQELEKLNAVVNSQEKIHYSFLDIFKIGQDNLIWLSWAPVFTIFLLFSKNKFELIYFCLIVFVVFIVGTLSLKTMICFIAASLAGFFLRKKATDRIQGIKGS